MCVLTSSSVERGLLFNESASPLVAACGTSNGVVIFAYVAISLGCFTPIENCRNSPERLEVVPICPMTYLSGGSECISCVTLLNVSRPLGTLKEMVAIGPPDDPSTSTRYEAVLNALKTEATEVVGEFLVFLTASAMKRES